MKICVFGLGYVGCVTLGCLAEAGHKVIGVDINNEKINLINKGLSPIVEKGINEIIEKQVSKKNIIATDDYLFAINNSDVSVICVGTPSSREGELNLEHVFDVSRQIGAGISSKDNLHTVVIRSTVPPGTNSSVSSIIEHISGKKSGIDFAVVSNPEFLREGTAVSDYYNPPMILLASESSKGIEAVKEIFNGINGDIVVSGIKSVELIKFVNNSFHALKVGFANEIGNICKKLVIDSHEVMDLFVRDKKLNLSSYYLKPGFAYGGYCLPKDLRALNNLSNRAELLSPIIASIEESNENHKRIALEFIEGIGKKNVGILGLTFKNGTDDLRNSAILDVISSLIQDDFCVRGYDPDLPISENRDNEHFANSLKTHLIIEGDLESLIKKSDTIVIAKNNSEYISVLDYINDKFVVDLVRIVDDFKHDNYMGICW